MTYAQDNGYTPVDFNYVMGEIREGINTQFQTSYTEESFVGTNYYKYYYPLVQFALKNETRTSEIFAKLSEYISQTNLRIQRPSVSLPGIIESFAANGWVASVKKSVVGTEGTMSVCVDTDNTDPNYATTKLEICTFLSQFIAAGMVFLGTETEDITLSNGQQFSFGFFLPDYSPILLRLTLTPSVNTLLTIPDDEVIRQQVFDQINQRYRLGWDFEPEKYFTTDDASWASEVLLEYSTNDGGTWSSDVFSATFKDLLTFGLEDIQIIVQE